MKHNCFGAGEREVPVIGQGALFIDAGNSALAIAALRRRSRVDQDCGRA